MDQTKLNEEKKRYLDQVFEIKVKPFIEFTENYVKDLSERVDKNNLSAPPFIYDFGGIVEQLKPIPETSEEALYLGTCLGRAISDVSHQIEKIMMLLDATKAMSDKVKESKKEIQNIESFDSQLTDLLKNQNIEKSNLEENESTRSPIKKKRKKKD